MRRNERRWPFIQEEDDNEIEPYDETEDVRPRIHGWDDDDEW